jgi:uncharacterized protein YwbE
VLFLIQGEHDLTIHAESRQAAAALHALLHQMYSPKLPNNLLQLMWLLIAADSYGCAALMKEIQAELGKLLEEQAELDEGPVEDTGQEPQDLRDELRQGLQTSLEQHSPQKEGRLTWEVVRAVYQVSLSYPQHIQKKQGLLWPLWKACTRWVGMSKEI